VARDLADRRLHAGGRRHRPELLAAHAGLSAPVIALHGGAGTIRRARSRPERTVLERALQAGYGILQDGGSSLEAVAAVVVMLEDSGVFNAGRGAAPNADGEIELDAGIMDGATLRDRKSVG